MSNANLIEDKDIGSSQAEIAKAIVISLQTSPATKFGALPDDSAVSVRSVVGGLEALVEASPELQRALEEVMARNVRHTLALTSGAAVPSTDDFKTMLRTQTTGTRSKGGPIVRTYWWGFSVQISHQDLDMFLGGAFTVNAIATAIGGGIPSPAQPFFLLIGGFILATIGALKALDRGQGIYISMLWWMPGAFVPTAV